MQFAAVNDPVDDNSSTGGGEISQLLGRRSSLSGVGSVGDPEAISEGSLEEDIREKSVEEICEVEKPGDGPGPSNKSPRRSERQRENSSKGKEKEKQPAVAFTGLNENGKPVERPGATRTELKLLKIIDAEDFQGIIDWKVNENGEPRFLPLSTGNKFRSACAQMIGKSVSAKEICTRCEKDNNAHPFQSCAIAVLPDGTKLFGGSCANCAWSQQDSHCTLRKHPPQSLASYLGAAQPLKTALSGKSKAAKSSKLEETEPSKPGSSKRSKSAKSTKSARKRPVEEESPVSSPSTSPKPPIKGARTSNKDVPECPAWMESVLGTLVQDLRNRGLKSINEAGEEHLDLLDAAVDTLEEGRRHLDWQLGLVTEVRDRIMRESQKKKKPVDTKELLDFFGK